VRFGFFIIQLQRAHSSVTNFRVGFERLYVSIRQPQP
jgi:hypothetical protein